MATCGECFYVGDQTGGSMTCHRYPQPHRVARSYWCGEHKPRQVDKPAPDKKRLRAPLTVADYTTVTGSED